ncbi:hypothetical protein HYS48_04845 [Candidatus Woesearchaeota archaeon]|nr:hypothetical protein [Candidatus Woesearchaeota archaeon]
MEAVGRVNIQEGRKLQQEVAVLRKRLNALNAEKESWFRQTKQHEKSMKELQEKFRVAKRQRDVLTQEVKKLKEERGKVIQEIRVKIAQVKKLEGEKITLRKEQDVRWNSGQLKAQMDRLEMKLETEAMPFDKEQKIMKEIKEKKKLLGEMKGILEGIEQERKGEKEIREGKRKAYAIHANIQEKARQSQEQHEKLVQYDKEMQETQQKQEETYQQYSKGKREFQEVNAQLQEKLALLAKWNMVAEEEREKRIQEKQRRIENILKEKERAVHEKMARGEKLTTEDLLALQGMGE